MNHDREYQVSYYRKNCEARKAATKKWRRENLEKSREWERVWYANKKLDPIFRIKKNLRNRLRNALRRNQKGGSAVTDLGCSVEFFRVYISGLFKSGMSWENYGEWHLDHIKPLSSFDLSDVQQVRQACHYTNLQPLWASDNLRKGARSVVK